MGCIPTWDCDVFSLRGHNVSDSDTTGSRKVGAPIFSGRAHFFYGFGYYMVLKKIDLVFILASPILVLTKVVMKYLVFCFLFF